MINWRSVVHYSFHIHNCVNVKILLTSNECTSPLTKHQHATRQPDKLTKFDLSYFLFSFPFFIYPSMSCSSRRGSGMCYSTHDASFSSYSSVLSPKRQMEVESCASVILFRSIGNNSQLHTPHSQGQHTPNLLSSYGVQIHQKEAWFFSESQRTANHSYTTMSCCYYTKVNYVLLQKTSDPMPWMTALAKCYKSTCKI